MEVQDDFLKRKWYELPQEEKDNYGFEYDTMKVLEDLIGQIDKRIYLNKRKVEGIDDLPPDAITRVMELDAAIKQLQDKVNSRG